MAAIDWREGRCRNLPVNPRFSLFPDKRQKAYQEFCEFRASHIIFRQKTDENAGRPQD
jgi:hypothetical protein